MRIEVRHDLSSEKAIEKIDSFLDQLSSSKMLAGISIVNPQKNWSGNVMNLSFKAKKGFLGIDVKGSVTVLDDSVVIEIDIPAIVASFVSEDEIRSVIASRAQALLKE